MRPHLHTYTDGQAGMAADKEVAAVVTGVRTVDYIQNKKCTGSVVVGWS